MLQPRSARTWRELIGSIIEDPQEKQRLATALGVRPLTLERWRDRKTDPHPNNLKMLLSTLPELKEQLVRLIEIEYAGFFSQADEGPREILSSFYSHFLRDVVLTPEPRFWSITSTLFQQALFQLDPERLGMALSVMLCMPPRNEKIQSLRVCYVQGTPPWRTDFSEQPLFLGTESLAGLAVSRGHREVIPNVHENKTLPFHTNQTAKAVAAFPLLRAGHIAGALVAESAIPDYFVPSRLELLEGFTNLETLALTPQDFYPAKDIALRVMPKDEIQEPYLSPFHQRVSLLLREASQREEILNKPQAELKVWQEIEGVFLDGNVALNS